MVHIASSPSLLLKLAFTRERLAETRQTATSVLCRDFGRRLAPPAGSLRELRAQEKRTSTWLHTPQEHWSERQGSRQGSEQGRRGSLVIALGSVREFFVVRQLDSDFACPNPLSDIQQVTSLNVSFLTVKWDLYHPLPRAVLRSNCATGHIVWLLGVWRLEAV